MSRHFVVVKDSLNVVKVQEVNWVISSSKVKLLIARAIQKIQNIFKARR